MQRLTAFQTKSILWTDLMMVIGGALLLFACSQIRIPLHPIPITLQTVAVMIVGLTYSPRRVLETYGLWLGLAALGVPVLSGLSGGYGVLMGPSAGYFVGFVLASYSMAFLKKQLALNSWKGDLMLVLWGSFCVFFCGVSWLAHAIGWHDAFVYGLYPFILPGIVKAGVLCTALQVVRQRHRG